MTNDKQPVTHDLQNRPYARLSQLKPGSTIIVDDGFSEANGYDCHLEPWSEHRVKQLPKGQEQYPGDRMLYISCAEGRHMLDGQLQGKSSDPLDYLIGIYHKEDFVK